MSDMIPFDDPLDNEPAPAEHPAEVSFEDISELDWGDVADEALGLLKDYVPLRTTDPAKARLWAKEQLRLLALADARGDTEFLQNYPRSLKLLAQSQGVVIARGREHLIRDRFVLITRLVLRILLK